MVNPLHVKTHQQQHHHQQRAYYPIICTQQQSPNICSHVVNFKCNNNNSNNNNGIDCNTWSKLPAKKSCPKSINWINGPTKSLINTSNANEKTINVYSKSQLTPIKLQFCKSWLYCNECCWILFIFSLIYMLK